MSDKKPSSQAIVHQNQGIVQYVTQVYKDDEPHNPDTVYFGNDADGNNFLRIFSLRPNGSAFSGGGDVYDSRFAEDKLGFNPQIAHETHQTVLSTLGYGINVDLVALLIWEHQHISSPSSALLGEVTFLGRSVELYVSDHGEEYHIVEWENGDWNKDDGIPRVFSHYRNRRLALQHFEMLASNIVRQIQTDDVDDHIQNKAQFE